MKATINFGKSYEKQTEEVKAMICKEDFYQVANLLGFKKRLKDLKKGIDKKQRVWYYNYRKRENS